MPEPQSMDNHLPNYAGYTHLGDLPQGKEVTIIGFSSSEASYDKGTTQYVQRLQNLGFLPGQRLKIMHRSKNKSASLIVMLEQTLWGLRFNEAKCVQVCE